MSHARSVVESVVENGGGASTPLGNGVGRTGVVEPPNDIDPVFETERGAFVTLEKDGELRGCIGRPRAEQPAIEAIREAAIGAATDDPRFPPVGPDELDSITVEVSVLTPPKPLEVDEPSAYPDAITVGLDGLIVHYDGRSGLLLPQVPIDQGWSAREFLGGTCQKAGLPASAWRELDLTVESFQAQIFAERVPGGPIEAVEPTPEVDG